MNSQINVLYVDDEPELLQLTKIFLERLGYFSVTTITSARQAIELLQIHSFDIIISDYQMPDIDGIAFLAHLKAKGDTTPFILFTGKGREEIVIEALNTGADFYLQKGGDPKAQFAELSTKIQSAVSRKRAEKEVLESQKKLLDIIDFLPDATFAINETGEVIAWNRAMEIMTGVKKTHILGKPDYAYSLPFYGSSRYLLLDYLDKSEESIPTEYKNIQKIGNTLYGEIYYPALYEGNGAYVWVTAAPLFDMSGSRVGAIESIRNISEQKKAESLLHKKNYELQVSYEQIAATEEELRSNLEELSVQEQLLRISEERLLMAQEISKTGCWEYNVENNTIWGSAEGLRIFGFPPVSGDFPITEIEDCIPEREKVHQALVDLLTIEAEYNLVYLIKPADGSSEKWIHSVARLEKNAKGTSIKVMGIIQDITEEKNAEMHLQKNNYELQAAYEQITAAEEELRANIEYLTQQEQIIRKSQEMYQLLYMHMIEGAALHELVYDNYGEVSDYKIIEINNAYERQSGIFRDAVIGKTSREAYGVNDPPYLDIYRSVALTNVPQTFETYFEPLDKHFSISAYSPYPGSFATIFQDITNRVKSEEEQENLITQLEVNNEQLNSAYEELSSTEEELRRQYNILEAAEKELYETKEFLENLFSIANVPIIVWDSFYRITRVNRACEFLIGRSAQEVIGQSLQIIFPPDQADRILRLLRTTIEGVRWETVEIDMMHQDGTLKTVLWNSATLYSQEGNTPIATIAQGRDITHERRLESDRNNALLQIQKNLAQLSILNDEIRNPLTIIVTYADMIDDPDIVDKIVVQAQRIDIMVNQLDRRWLESEKVLNAIRKHYHIHSDSSLADNDEKISLIEQSIDSLQINPELNLNKDFMTGILIEEVQAQLYTILDSIDAFIYVADMQTFEILFINRKGRSQFGNIIGQKCYKRLHINQDEPCSFCTNKYLMDESGPLGVYHWEWQHPSNRKWFDCRDRIIRWSDGRMVRLEIATDITEQKRNTAKLLESQEQFRILSENAPVGILNCDKQGNILYLNPKILELTGSKNIEETKKINLITFPPLVKTGLSAVLLQTLEDGVTIPSFEFEYTSVWGKTVYYLAHITAIRKDSQVIGALIIMDDISQRKRNEESIIEANKKIRLLTSLTRHDIYNQLSIIDNFLNLALKSESMQKIQEYVSYAQQAKDQIEKIISFTREYEGFGIDASGWQRISSIVQSAINEVSSTTIVMENLIPQNLVVYVDPIIKKVFTTLIDNALRHGEKVSKIVFLCVQEKDDMIIAIQDDGIGIFDSEKESIFDHEYGKNTGIGLFLSKEILSITGLAISECGFFGAGARFEIVIPNGKYTFDYPDSL